MDYISVSLPPVGVQSIVMSMSVCPLLRGMGDCITDGATPIPRAY